MKISLAQIPEDDTGETANGNNQNFDTVGIYTQDTVPDSMRQPPGGGGDDSLRNPMEDTVRIPGSDSALEIGGEPPGNAVREAILTAQGGRSGDAMNAAPHAQSWQLAEKEIREFGRGAKDSLDNLSAAALRGIDRGSLKRQIDSIVDYTNLELEEIKRGTERSAADASARIRQITDESKRRIRSLVDSVTTSK
jgi:hypothetical protein